MNEIKLNIENTASGYIDELELWYNEQVESVIHGVETAIKHYKLGRGESTIVAPSTVKKHHTVKKFQSIATPMDKENVDPYMTPLAKKEQPQQQIQQHQPLKEKPQQIKVVKEEHVLPPAQEEQELAKIQSEPIPELAEERRDSVPSMPRVSSCSSMGRCESSMSGVEDEDVTLPDQPVTKVISRKNRANNRRGRRNKPAQTKRVSENVVQKEKPIEEEKRPDRKSEAENTIALARKSVPAVNEVTVSRQSIKEQDSPNINEVTVVVKPVPVQEEIISPAKEVIVIQDDEAEKVEPIIEVPSITQIEQDLSRTDIELEVLEEQDPVELDVVIMEAEDPTILRLSKQFGQAETPQPVFDRLPERLSTKRESEKVTQVYTFNEKIDPQVLNLEDKISTGSQFSQPRFSNFSQDTRDPDISNDFDDDMGDTIAINIQPYAHQEHHDESPVKELKLYKPVFSPLDINIQSKIYSPVDIKPSSKSTTSTDDDRFKLFDLEQKIKKLKGSTTPERKSSIPQNHKSYMSSPDVNKIIERASSIASPPARKSKFFQDEEEVSPSTPDRKSRKLEPPKLHMNQGRFIALSPRPSQEELKQARLLQSAKKAAPAPPKEAWTANQNIDAMEISPSPIATSKKSVPSRLNDLPEIQVDKQLFSEENNPEQQSVKRASGTKRKFEPEPTFENQHKRIKLSDPDALSSFRLSATSMTSLSSISSIGSFADDMHMDDKPGSNPFSPPKAEGRISETEEGENKGFFSNLLSNVTTFLQPKKVEPPKKKGGQPIKSLERALQAKKKEEQRQMEKKQALQMRLQKMKLKENLEAEKKKKLEQERKIALHKKPASNTVAAVPKPVKVTNPVVATKLHTGSIGSKSLFQKPPASKQKLPPKTLEDSYPLSDESYCSEDEDAIRKRRMTKKVPEWVRSTEMLREAITRTAQLDPDVIFAPVNSCDLEAIFSNTHQTRKRTSSMHWSNDKFTEEEELAYKRAMGWK